VYGPTGLTKTEILLLNNEYSNMESSLLLPLSMYTDVKTTKNLIKASDIFNEVPDIWRLKFNHDYPNRKYLDFWSSETNYRLQGKQFAIMVVGSPVVDDILYKYNDLKKHAFDKINEYIRPGASYEAASLIKIEVKERYVIIYNTDEFWWTETPVLYASTFEEAESISRDLMANCKEANGEWYEGFIIDLNGMTPEFCYDKNTFKASAQFYTRFRC
jgi:hypothetical protein